MVINYHFYFSLEIINFFTRYFFISVLAVKMNFEYTVVGNIICTISLYVLSKKLYILYIMNVF